MKVVDPLGRTVRVRRRWLPWRRRIRDLERVLGWSASRDRIREIAAIYARGDGPFPAHDGG